MTTTCPGGAWASETVWNWGVEYGSAYDGIGSGGGISTSYSIPPWQQGVSMTNNQGSTTMRNIPDVALIADCVWVMYGDGDAGAFGGTSCAAPLWAGFIALVNQQAAGNGKPTVGFINPAIYAIGQSASYTNCFHDITTGNNTWSESTNQFYAVPGYDLCTGWGTPTGSNLINALVGNCGGPYSITTSSSPVGGGSTSGGGTVACGFNVTVCATPNACYSFVNWTDQNSNFVSASGCYTFTATNSETLVANFTPIISCTITTSSSPVGGGSTSGGGTVACGPNVTVCATPNAGYSFLNWTLFGSVVSTSACYTFAAPSNETFVANFTPCSVSTSTSPANGGSTSGGGPVACGSNVTVCATPNACYKFVNWTLNGYGYTPAACCSFTVTGNETVVANFALIPYTITTRSSPPGYGSTSGGGTYACGSNATVSATANACYSFVNWTVNGTGVSTSASYTFTVVTNETLVANFALSRGSTNGSLTILYAFGSSPDGYYPVAGLVQGSDSNFYGTASAGGANTYYGQGTVFRISSSGTYTTLYSFGSHVYDGDTPQAGLVQGSDSNFYGTTYYGGSGNCDEGCGTVFRISSSGTYTTLYSFVGYSTDGLWPQAGLVQGSDGNFYGTTTSGGTNDYGTVFRISPSGSYTQLYSFAGPPNDGDYPAAGLVQGSDGNFYGTTYNGGTHGWGNGTVFRITPSGSLTNLWSFTGDCDGDYPAAGLVQGSDGNFYGTASGGGASDNGTVFKLTVPLNPPPPVASFTASPTSGAAPLSVSFTDTSSGSPTSWSWTFGGNVSTNQDPANTYTNPGSYTAQLIASNAGGPSTNTATATISVYDPFTWWQQGYGLTNNCALCGGSASYTGDGMSNTNKFLAGFSPTNAAAYLHVISIVETGNDINVTYLGANGDTDWTPGVQSRTNILEYSTGNPADGSYSNNFVSTGQSQILGGGTGLGIVTNMVDAGGATSTPSRYYRVRVLLP